MRAKGKNKDLLKTGLLPKLWQLVDCNLAVRALFELLVLSALQRECGLDGIRTLLGHWLETFLENTHPSAQMKEFEKILGKILLTREQKVKSTDYLYILRDVMIEKVIQHNRQLDFTSVFSVDTLVMKLKIVVFIAQFI